MGKIGIIRGFWSVFARAKRIFLNTKKGVKFIVLFSGFFKKFSPKASKISVFDDVLRL